MKPDNPTGAISKNFNDAIKSRWDHPVAGPFLFFWVILNSDLLMVLFSDGAYNSKLTFLQENFPLNHLAINSALALLSAVVYVIVAQLSDPLQEAASIAAVAVKNSINKHLIPGRSYKQVDIDRLHREFNNTLTHARGAHEEALLLSNTEAAASKEATAKVLTTLAAVRGLAEELQAARLSCLALGAGYMGNDRKYKFRTRGHMQDRISGLYGQNGIGEIHIQILKILQDGLTHSEAELISTSGVVTQAAMEELAELHHRGSISIGWVSDTTMGYKLNPLGHDLIVELNHHYPDWGLIPNKDQAT